MSHSSTPPPPTLSWVSFIFCMEVSCLIVTVLILLEGRRPSPFRGKSLGNEVAESAPNSKMSYSIKCILAPVQSAMRFFFSSKCWLYINVLTYKISSIPNST